MALATLSAAITKILELETKVEDLLARVASLEEGRRNEGRQDLLIPEKPHGKSRPRKRGADAEF
jgi:hypothetical protein